MWQIIINPKLNPCFQGMQQIMHYTSGIGTTLSLEVGTLKSEHSSIMKYNIVYTVD
jgi:carbon monoxide dehydrogenase subunit G